MRNAFASEMTALAQQDARVVLLSGDIGNRLFNDFKDKAPGRFFNCGVAEANMIGMASGLALSGLRPVTYTITTFTTLRCLEQIRLDVCYHNLPVVIVGVGAGLSYSALNATHHALEDLAILRVMPNMTILCPADQSEVRGALGAALRHDGPVYVRLGKKGEPKVHATAPAFEIGRWIPLREGADACLLAVGTMASVAQEAAERLTAVGLSTRVYSCHTVKPLDTAVLSDAFSRFPVVASIEEHAAAGGFGGAVAEWLADRGPVRARFHRFGTADRFMYEAGEQEHAREIFGLTPEAIAHRVAALHREQPARV
jgi:transketolase